MENKLPCPIISEKDLTVYENYLKQDNQNQSLTFGRTKNVQVENSACISKPQLEHQLSNPAFLQAYLRNNVGKLVKVEAFVGGNSICRIGTLLQVGLDFVVLKLYQSCSTMLIELSTVKFVTVIHDNDGKNIRMY